MIKAILNIRFKQILRELKNIGIFRMLILVSFVFFFGYILYVQTTLSPNKYYAAGVYFLVITYIHIMRKDYDFLNVNFDNFRQIYIVEYIVFSAPLLIFLAVNLEFLVISAYVLLLTPLSFIHLKKRKRTLNSKIQRFIPDDAIEWKAGLRKTFFIFIFLWFLGIVFSFYVGTVPVVIFILGILPISFFEYCEPVEMIVVFEKSSKNFLKRKIKQQFVIFSIIIIPLMIAFLLFNIEYWYVAFIEYFVLSTIHIYFVVIKYSFYEPNSKASASQVFSVLGSTSILFPVLLPLIWVMTFYFYLKAKQKLNFYLDDFN